MGHPRVVLLRGYSANPWDLRPWRLLQDRFDVSCLVPGANEFDASAIGLPVVAVRATRDPLPDARASRALAYAVGDRYFGLEEALAGASIVHSADLATWFSAQAAGLKERLGFRLVLTVWETIPSLATYRWPRERAWRARTLATTDLFVAASKRAQECLLLEGVAPERIVVSYPGIDTEHFAPSPDRPAIEPGLVLSPGRLVWQKGHQDVIRAVAALRSGIVPGAPDARLLVLGSGPEGEKLRRYADELGLGSAVEIRGGVPYDAMPDIYSRASCMVLASLARKDWEEQFGMVLAESLAAGVPIIASASGAIPEVVGDSGRLFTPGDWVDIAKAIAEVARATCEPRGGRSCARRAVFVGRGGRAHRGRLRPRARTMTADRRWAIVVLSWNGREDTLACLSSLAGLDWPGIDVICVDNGSSDGSPEAVRADFPAVTVIENGSNLGFAGGNNVGIRAALERGADWVLLLNNDATLAPDAVRELDAVAGARPRAGVLGGKVLFAEPPHRVWFAGQRFNSALGYSGRPRGYGKPDGESLRAGRGGRPRGRGVHGRLARAHRSRRAARRGAVRVRRGRRLVAAGARGGLRRAARPERARLAPRGRVEWRRDGLDAVVLLRRAQHDRRVRAPPPAAAGTARGAPGRRRGDVRRACGSRQSARPAAARRARRCARRPPRPARSAQRALVGLQGPLGRGLPGEDRCAQPSGRAQPLA